VHSHAQRRKAIHRGKKVHTEEKRCTATHRGGGKVEENRGGGKV